MDTESDPKISLEQSGKRMGFRQLSEGETKMIERIREKGRELEQLVAAVGNQAPELVWHGDPRWTAIGKTHLQEGLMALVRAVTKPDFF